MAGEVSGLRNARLVTLNQDKDACSVRTLHIDSRSRRCSPNCSVWPPRIFPERQIGIALPSRAAQANGMGLEEVLDFYRHRDVKVLMVYRDRERDVQGQLASLVAASV